MKKVCIIFGGSGFIATHFLSHLAAAGDITHVVLADMAPLRHDFHFNNLVVEHVYLDVRTSPDSWMLPKNVELIANFAAIHREPGHQSNEYYETNLPGAENVCTFAERVGCNKIIFTSSIAPYGPTESVKTEKSTPTPISSYGGSKLVAEKIHLGWQCAGVERKLVIVRPGVVFGAGEGGNVTRLVQATVRRYFFYMGNRYTRKAGGYVKELVNSMLWMLDTIPENGGSVLYNFTMEQAPTVEEYVTTVCKVAGIKRWIPSAPYPLFLALSYFISFLTKPLGIKQPINPTRIRKLVKSNNIEPSVLREYGYKYQYSLETAMRDWFKDCPEEWA